MIADEVACQELVELITDYLEGTLPPDERARFDAHLAECPGCRTYLAQIWQTIRTLQRLDDDRLSARTKEDLLRLYRDWKRE
jgi:anti-sigma factor RsiW